MIKKHFEPNTGLSLETVARVLTFFTSRGFAEQKGPEFFAGPTRIHLPSDSPLISKHHANWRMQAIASLDHQRANDLHYLLVMSLSEEAAEKIRSILLNSVQETEPVFVFLGRILSNKALFPDCLGPVKMPTKFLGKFATIGDKSLLNQIFDHFIL